MTNIVTPEFSVYKVDKLVTNGVQLLYQEDSIRIIFRWSDVNVDQRCTGWRIWSHHVLIPLCCQTHRYRFQIHTIVTQTCRQKINIITHVPCKNKYKGRTALQYEDVANNQQHAKNIHNNTSSYITTYSP